MKRKIERAVSKKSAHEIQDALDEIERDFGDWTIASISLDEDDNGTPILVITVQS